MRGVTLEKDVLHHELFVTDARTLLDRALDDVAGDRLLARLFHRGGEAGISLGISASDLRCDHDFFDEFAGGLRLFQRGDARLA